MPQLIEVPGQGVVEFPDGMSDGQIAAAIKRNLQPGIGEDVAKAVPSSAAKGMINLAGAPADILGFLTSGAASLAGKVSPEHAEAFKQAAKPELPLPTSKAIRSGVEGITGPLYDAKTRLGKMIGGTVEAAAPGGLFGKGQAALGAISGGASEVAGAVTNDSPYAKAIAGLLAPLGAQAGHAYRSMPGQMLREATGDVDPAEWERARGLLERGKAQGVDLMAPEALGPSSIQQLASDVIASKEGGRVMNQFLANRPEQVKKAVNAGLLDRVGMATTPDESMGRAKEAATGVIRGAEKARSAAVRPAYEAARRDVVPPENIQAIIDQIDNGLAYMSPESRAAAEAFKRSLTQSNPNAVVLDDLYKTTRNTVNLPAIGATPQQKSAAAAVAPFNSSLDETLKFSSPNIKAGREQYRQITQDVIDPLTAGPVGRVAGKQGFDPSVPQTLNPVAAVANEKVARPESIRELYGHLNKQDPKAFPGMVRTWLENAFDGAAQKVQAGESRMSGANFTKAVYGTPQQEANFAEAMRGVAAANGKDTDDFVRGAKNLMEILQATGKVPAAGSPTGGRLPTNEMAGRSGWATSLETISSAPLRPMAKKIREWAMGGNYRKLAEILTAPDSIDKIIQIGKYKPTTTTSMALTIGLLEANAESAQ